MITTCAYLPTPLTSSHGATLKEKGRQLSTLERVASSGLNQVIVMERGMITICAEKTRQSMVNGLLGKLGEHVQKSVEVVRSLAEEHVQIQHHKMAEKNVSAMMNRRWLVTSKHVL